MFMGFTKSIEHTNPITKESAFYELICFAVCNLVKEKRFPYSDSLVKAMQKATRSSYVTDFKVLFV